MMVVYSCTKILLAAKRCVFDKLKDVCKTEHTKETIISIKKVVPLTHDQLYISPGYVHCTHIQKNEICVHINFCGSRPCLDNLSLVIVWLHKTFNLSSFMSQFYSLKFRQA